MSFDPAKTAVVLIEYQNDFTSEGGVLHGAVQGVMERTGMLANTKHVVEAARAAGATIMHAPITFARDTARSARTRTASSRASSTARRSSRAPGARRSSRSSTPKDGRHRRRGQARARHVREHEPRLHPPQPRHHDHRARRVPDQLLRRVDDAHGYEKGYEVITLTDCVAATSAEEHENALKYDYPMFSKPMTSAEVIAELG